MAIHHGQFCWYDLMTTDTAAATAFYGTVVGWTATDASQPGMPYTTLATGGTPVAGLMPIPEAVTAAGGRPGWMGYVLVDDVEAAAARIRAAGGHVHRAPTDIPGVGRFAVVADPQGAVFQIFHGNGTLPPDVPIGTPGFVGWRELHATAGDAAFGFYAAQFGWTKAEAVDMGPMGTYQLFASGDTTAAGGMMTKMESMPHPVWAYYFNVEDIEAAAARVTGAGGSILNGPHQVPGGSWIVNCMDPQGAMFSLTAPPH